jgi:CheY-like chemotaxis protein
MSYKVLLVDDHDISLLFQKILWKNRFGILPVMAKSADEALSLMQNKVFDFIVVDYSMYGIQGDELVKIIRQMPEYKDIPVVMLSTRCEMETAEKCLKAGANDFLMKPIDEDVYFNRINKLLDLSKIPTTFKFDLMNV